MGPESCCQDLGHRGAGAGCGQFVCCGSWSRPCATPQGHVPPGAQGQPSRLGPPHRVSALLFPWVRRDSVPNRPGLSRQPASRPTQPTQPGPRILELGSPGGWGQCLELRADVRTGGGPPHPDPFLCLQPPFFSPGCQGGSVRDPLSGLACFSGWRQWADRCWRL